MAYKYHKEPHELFSNNAHLHEPTEEQKKIMENHEKMVREKLKKAFPEIDIDAQTFDPKKK